jgi:hypothetical protein
MSRNKLESIRYVDLSQNKCLQYLVDREESQYLGHPDSILLDDGTILVFYPKGHGKGPIVMKKSVDGGKTWGERLPTPESWTNSQETPTIYQVVKPDGTRRLELISGVPWDEGGFRTAYSEDNGQSWTEFKHYYPGLHTIVAHASLTRLKDSEGNWDNRWMGLFHDHEFNNWKTILSFDENGQERWSKPQRLLAEHNEIEKHAGLCEIEIMRAPDGKQLALLARAQHKRINAMVAFSNDEGETWSQPREAPQVLMGERHKAQYDPVSGRLLITFRQIIRKERNDGEDQWIAGDWCAWVGTYEDLYEGRMGEYYIRLMQDFTGDCGYAGNVALPDGTFVLTSYGHWDKEYRNPFVMTVRLKISQLDDRFTTSNIL